MRRVGKLFTLVLSLCLAGCNPVTKTALGQTSEKGQSAVVSPYEGGQAPDFSLRDLATGTVISKASLLKQHKFVFINAFASWCGPCKAEMNDVLSAQKKYGNQVVFVEVNMTSQETSVADVRSFVHQYKIPYKVLLDPSGSFLNTYAVNGFPTSFLMNSHGVIVKRQDGMFTNQSLGEFFAQGLKQTT